jgi:filamentous hemagglutinin family protein
MNTHVGHGNSNSRKQGAVVVHAKSFRISPLAQAMALALAAGAATVPVHAQQRAFSPTWFNAKGAAQATATATGLLPNGLPASSLAGPLAQQQRANAQLQQSIGNLNLAARGIAAQQAAQEAARRAAQNEPSVPDGLADGGLKVDTNSASRPAGSTRARTPVSVAAGRRPHQRHRSSRPPTGHPELGDLQRRAQHHGRLRAAADWAVLNRVNDPQARPSQIQGQIKADGTVLIANRNGIVFSGSSQVDTRNLVAAAAHIDDAQFKANGMYANGNTPNFKNAGRAASKYRPGRRLTTPAPKSATQGGGYVLLLGSEVSNAGEIATPGGQAMLAAGDSFVIRKGVGTDGNQASTTRGNEVAVTLNAEQHGGHGGNTGLMQAPTGDVTLAGREVVQSGVVLSSTTVNTRGTVHLNATRRHWARSRLGQAHQRVRARHSGATALDSQRDGLMAGRRCCAPTAPAVHHAGAGNDRRDLSRIEIASGGTSSSRATRSRWPPAARSMVDAKRRSLVREGARSTCRARWA